MYAALPPDLLRSKALGAVRVDYYGRAAVELIIGAEFTRREEDILWVLVHKGHMRVLVPSEPDVLGHLYGAGIDVQELPALGWEALLELALTTRSPPALSLIHI